MKTGIKFLIVAGLLASTSNDSFAGKDKNKYSKAKLKQERIKKYRLEQIQKRQIDTNLGEIADTSKKTVNDVPGLTVSVMQQINADINKREAMAAMALFGSKSESLVNENLINSKCINKDLQDDIDTVDLPLQNVSNPDPENQLIMPVPEGFTPPLKEPSNESAEDKNTSPKSIDDNGELVTFQANNDENVGLFAWVASSIKGVAADTVAYFSQNPLEEAQKFPQFTIGKLLDLLPYDEKFSDFTNNKKLMPEFDKVKQQWTTYQFYSLSYWHIENGIQVLNKSSMEGDTPEINNTNHLRNLLNKFCIETLIEKETSALRVSGKTACLYKFTEAGEKILSFTLTRHHNVIVPNDENGLKDL